MRGLLAVPDIEHPALLSDLADIELSQHRFAEAEGYIQQALHLAPEHPHLLQGLAYCRRLGVPGRDVGDSQALVKR